MGWSGASRLISAPNRSATITPALAGSASSGKSLPTAK